MGREIKFKAKRLDNGEWAVGDLYHNIRGYDCIGQLEGKEVMVYPVDPTTVCQYTGKNAENDIPIYEGDIVECTYFNEQGDDTHVKGTITWEEDIWGFVLKDYMFENMSVGNRYRGEEYIALPGTDDTESTIKVLYSKFDKEEEK